MSYLLLFDHYDKDESKAEQGDEESMFDCESEEEDTLATELDKAIEAMKARESGKERVVYVRREGRELKPEKPPKHERTFHNTKQR